MLFYFPKSVFSSLRALLFAFVVLASNAFAGELITHSAYVEDATGQKSLQDIAAEVPTQFTGVLSRGYTDAAVWLKLEITPPSGAKADDDIVLRIRPFYLDEIRLFDPLDRRGTPRTMGDAAPIQAGEFPSLSHTFVVPAGEQPRTIWLRVKTTSTCLVNVEALSRDEMTRSEFQINLAYFGVLAVIGMFALLVLISWVNHRDSLFALFVVRQIYYFFYTAALFGIYKVVLADVPNINLDVMFSWIVIISTVLSFFFEYRFLNEYSPPPWAKAVLNLLMSAAIIVCVLMALGYTRTALHANMQLSAIGILTWLVLSILFIDEKKVQADKAKVLLSKRMVVAYYVSVNAVVVITVLSYLGLIRGNVFAISGLVFYMLCSGLIMTVLMLLRANKQRAVQSEYEKNLMLSEQAVALEKTRREEQTHLFHMLMHELKTPLSIIDMALLAKNDQQTTSSYVGRAVANMKVILDRCVKADKLTEGNVDIRLTHVNLNQYIQNLIDDKQDLQVNWAPTQTLHVTTDIQFLGVMLSNLLDNADRYGDKQEAVQVHVASQHNGEGVHGVSVTVSNRPRSATWPDPDKVFKKYYRSASAESQPGTGLGLYLVRSLARLVGGDCLYLPDDKYVRFELWLPS